MSERDADEGVFGTGGTGRNDGPSAPRDVDDAEGLSSAGNSSGARGRADGSDIGNASDVGALGGDDAQPDPAGVRGPHGGARR